MANGGEDVVLSAGIDLTKLKRDLEAMEALLAQANFSVPAIGVPAAGGAQATSSLETQGAAVDTALKSLTSVLEGVTSGSLKLQNAMQRFEEVQAKAAIGIGNEGGYGSAGQQASAQRAAAAPLLSAAEKSTAQTQNALSPDQVSQLTQLASTNADVSSRGRASITAAQSTARLADIDRQLEATTQKALAGEMEYGTAVSRLTSLSVSRVGTAQQLMVAEKKLAEYTDQSASVGSITAAKNQFAAGFKGASDRPYLEQIGQAFKFSVFYGSAYKALFALTQTFQQALAEGIAFQQGLTDLQIATGQSGKAASSLAENLGKQATRAGASPSQGLEVGARAVGLYGATQAPAAVQDQVATISARVVSELAVNSKQDPVDLQNNIAAITQALGGGANAQIKVGDLDAYLTKRFGVAPGSTFDAVSQSASVGKAAGFTDEQIFSIAADLISRTGATSTAAGGYMAQIFTRGGEGSLSNVAGKFGVDPNQSLAKIAESLSAIYKSATPQQQTQIAGAFGRGKVQNAAVALLNDYPEVIGSAADASTDASGSMDKQFAAHMANIGGQIEVLTGSLKEFAHLFGESGLLDAVGLGIVVIKSLVDTLNTVLGLYIEIPHALRDVIGGLALFTAALKLTSSEETIGGALGALGRRATGGVTAAEGIAPEAFLGRYTAHAGTARAVGATAEVEAANAPIEAAGAGAGLLAAAPWVAAVGGIVAIASLASDAEKIHQATQDTVQALSSGPGADGSAADYSSYSDLLKSQAKTDRHSTGTVAQVVTLGHANDGLEASATQLDAEAKRTAAIAVKLQTQAANNPVKADAFGSFSADDISTGLAAVAANGGTAVDQLNALTGAIDGLGKKAAVQATIINPGTEATGLAGAAAAAKGTITDSGGGFTLTRPVSDYKGAIQQQLTGGELQKRLQAELKQNNITSFAQITPAMAAQMAASLGQLSDTGDLKAGGAELVEVPVQAAILKYLQNRIDHFKDATDGATKLTPNQVTAAITNTLTTGEATSADRPDADLSGKLAIAKANLVKVGRDVKAGAGGLTSSSLASIQKAKNDVVDAEYNQLEALRKVAVQNASSQSQATRLGQGFVQKEIESAVKGGDADGLARVLQGAGKGAIAIAQKVIADAINTAQYALNADKAMDLAAKRLAAVVAAETATVNSVIKGFSFGGVAPETTAPKATADPKTQQDQDYLNSLKGLQQVPTTQTSDLSADKIPKAAAAAAAKDTAAQIRAARAAANAAKKGGDIASANAAIIAATGDMHDAKKGTVAYYNALAAYYSARDQLNDAMRAYKNNLRELAIDITDPLAEARLAVNEARKKLTQDTKQGKAKDVKAQDRDDLKHALADRESTAFDQRLQDAQTAEALGQTSHTAYIRYLDNEHKRLTEISHRTRQQQDELNQIDQLMLDAAKEMQGAFNIGSITLPTPYQVRLYMQDQAQAGGASSPHAIANGAVQAATTTTTIYINGADTQMVKKVIDDHVGKSARVLTGANRYY